MKHYIVLQTIKTLDGQTILKSGDRLKQMGKGQYDCFGLDKVNLFYTDEFLDSKPLIFQKVNG